MTYYVAKGEYQLMRQRVRHNWNSPLADREAVQMLKEQFERARRLYVVRLGYVLPVEGERPISTYSDQELEEWEANLPTINVAQLDLMYFGDQDLEAWIEMMYIIANG